MRPLRLLKPRADLTSLYEAASSDARDERAWSQGLFQAACQVFEGVTGLGTQFVEHDDQLNIHQLRAYGTGRAECAKAVAPRPEVARRMYYPSNRAVMLSQLDVDGAPLLAPYGATELGGVSGHPEANRVVFFFWSLDHRYSLTAQEQRLLERLGSYIETGIRLQRAAGVRGSIDLHGQALTATPALQANELWEELCAGRLNLAMRGKDEGRHLLLIDVPQAVQAERALTRNEREVLEKVAEGKTGKEQAFELDAGTTSASRWLTSGTFKLGLPKVTDAICLLGGLLKRGRLLRLDALTTSEVDVLKLVREGRSNREIAALRNRSVRTIANQVASILAKTGFPGRRALMAAPMA